MIVGIAIGIERSALEMDRISYSLSTQEIRRFDGMLDFIRESSGKSVEFYIFNSIIEVSVN